MLIIRDGTFEGSFKKLWPRWRKFAIVGILLTITIPSCVGLGVGLGCKPHSNGGDSLTSGNNAISIWQPAVGDSWQIVLMKPIKVDGGIVTPDVKIYDLDVYDNDANTIKALQKSGKKVICYFSAGSWENWRDDKDDFEKADLGKVLEGWPDERWIDVRSDNVRKIMKKRIEFAAEKGCDAIDPDNVDGFQNDNGLDLTAQDAIDFVRFLSETASSYNMSTGLKNAGDIIADVLEHVHFSVNEQCVKYSECEAFAAFIKADKPVFHIEYPAGTSRKVLTSARKETCSHSGNAAGTKGFSTVIKKMTLDGWVEYCGQGKTYSTELDMSA
ncbi:glycoside hydrolase superfamily [Dactylonectria estremocensis]|uniref:alpha-galactosidase n=1 Tax=Dactylonectria estremocensis TaxID=1079267 RepID=A0A9P9CY06_9HYPO|nr:glycoside hydrolase superfamily [Dactylonectria estremocensis]